MHKTTYQEALNRVRIGAPVEMANPSPCDYIEKGTRGRIVNLLGNRLNNPSSCKVLVSWHMGEGCWEYDDYELYDVPFVMHIGEIEK